MMRCPLRIWPPVARTINVIYNRKGMLQFGAQVTIVIYDPS